MLFWLVILVPIFYFFEFGYFSWQGRSVSLSAAGFTKFIDISKLPIGLLSLSIPLTALVAKLHSTAQTAKQIKLSNKQIDIAEAKNNQDLFYLHRREFIAYYQQVGETTFNGVLATSYKVTPRVHGRLFRGDVAKGVPALRTKVVDDLVRRVKLARASLADVIAGENGHRRKYATFCTEIYWVISFFGVRDIAIDLHKRSVRRAVSDNEEDFISVGANSEDAIAAYLCVENYLLSTLEFAGYSMGRGEMAAGKVDFLELMRKHASKNTIEKILQ